MKQSINKVNGTIKIGEKETQIEGGKLVGNQLTFALTDQPDMKYTCTIDGANITGTAKGANAAGGEAQLAGSRQGADAAPQVKPAGQ